MKANEESYTAIDFAGMIKSYEGLLIMLDFYKHNFHLVQQIFALNSAGKPDWRATNLELDHSESLESPWVITRVH